MKSMKISLVLLGILLLFTACTSKAQTNASQVNTPSSQAVSEAPGRVSEIYGKVKTILGNEITLSLAEQQAELSDAEKEKRRNEMQALSAEERQKLRLEQIKFTGETTTVIIPIGIPITSGNLASADVGLKEVALSDIYEGIFLRIWLEKGGNGEEKTAEYVRVLQPQQ